MLPPGAQGAQGVTVNELVGHNIRVARQQLGLSQSELGERVLPPVSHTTVTKIEQGTIRLTVERLYQIANACAVDPQRLLQPAPRRCPACGQEIAGARPAPSPITPAARVPPA